MVVAALYVVLFPLTQLVAGSTVTEGLKLPNGAKAVDRLAAAEKQAAAINAVRQTLLQATVGLAAVVALFFTARSYLLNQRGQYTQRYKDAIEQLSSDKMASRIGGIYALEHVMRESRQDHETVVEVLAAFVRENAPRTGVAPQLVVAPPRGQWMHPPTGVEEPAAPVKVTKGPPTDVQTALTVIGRRPKRPEKNHVDLSNTDLQNANLFGANLQHARLVGANLQNANLRDANLQNANLRDANLQHAYLIEADLQHANLRDANLQHANLIEADLQHANLRDADLQNANLVGANLQNARLVGANLQNANLVGANLQHANLSKAKLDYADLRGATGVDLTGVASQEGVVLDSHNGKPFGDGSG
ncbi:pentapeptide repeat-containing protein [Nocardiopsis ansamitocini]|uniref:pentapeptide repeat-containing protein n=1 Tax=Nocardiopsis ansamitocini TaxID=1670832 RepID=UPI0025569BB3|nr:pentapeptide repeat-containing protein [Nocardiopsis ansamitocini]